MKTKVEWAGENWNLNDGCDPEGPGCLNCYAAAQASRGMCPDHVGLTRKVKRRNAAGRLVSLPVFNGVVNLQSKRLLEPLRRRAPTRFFVDSMSDFMHAKIPHKYRAAAYGVMAVTPHHTYLVLTKRDPRLFYDWMLKEWDRHGDTIYDLILSSAADYAPDKSRWERAVARCGFDQCLPECEPWPLPNVHLGGSAANQARFDLHAPRVLGVNAAVNWMSLEPLIGPIDVSSGLKTRWRCAKCGYRTDRAGQCKGYCYDASGESCDAVPCPGCGKVHYWTGSMAGLDWVVVGGESGPGARPCHVEWIRSIVEQCKGTRTRVFVKQLGAHVIDRSGNRFRLVDPKGGNMDEWPEDLRVREYPAGEWEG